jgi:hypothetical protein
MGLKSVAAVTVVIIGISIFLFLNFECFRLDFGDDGLPSWSGSERATMTRQPRASKARTGRNAWSVVVVLALMIQGLLALAPAKAADSFGWDVAAICSVAGKAAGQDAPAHDPAASHCPLCQNLQPSLGLAPPPAPALLRQAKPRGLPGQVHTAIGPAFLPIGFLSRAPPRTA